VPAKFERHDYMDRFDYTVPNKVNGPNKGCGQSLLFIVFSQVTLICSNLG